MAAGLGSSAAATVAGLRIFERVTRPLPDRSCWVRPPKSKGHADNAAPALFGGLTSVRGRRRRSNALRWTWPEGLCLVVATPSVGLATAKARAALPEMLPRRTRFSTCSVCCRSFTRCRAARTGGSRGGAGPLAPARARGARAAAARGAGAETPRSSVRSCRAPDRRSRCSRGEKRRMSSSAGRAVRARGRVTPSRCGRWRVAADGAVDGRMRRVRATGERYEIRRGTDVSSVRCHVSGRGVVGLRVSRAARSDLRLRRDPEGDQPRR